MELQLVLGAIEMVVQMVMTGSFVTYQNYSQNVTICLKTRYSTLAL
jgi:hypothetical protein